jgi:diaminopimelate decarboxylase
VTTLVRLPPKTMRALVCLRLAVAVPVRGRPPPLPKKQRTQNTQVASFGELACALAAGFDPKRIVFDSPAKTARELAYALEKGVAVNIDNAQELARAAALLEANPTWQDGALIGLRVNPQVGAGAIAALSTGGAVSKFGWPLLEERDAMIAAYVRYPWLNMLHLHVGSQGLPTALIAEGVARVWQLLEDIDAACGGRRVVVLDIGGGLRLGGAVCG